MFLSTSYHEKRLSAYLTDRATTLDEIVGYVKFSRLQVKVLSMSRGGGAAASLLVAADSPLPPFKDEVDEDGSNQRVWGRWSTGNDTEQQVGKLMIQDAGAAMQFLQSNGLYVLPISLILSICQMHDQPVASLTFKPDTGCPS